MYTELVSIVSTAFGDLIANGIIIFALCFVIGQSIKKVTIFKKIPNDNIPFICMAIGAICAVAAPTIFFEDPLCIKIFKGVILGWSATGLYEMIRHREYDLSDDDDDNIDDEEKESSESNDSDTQEDTSQTTEDTDITCSDMIDEEISEVITNNVSKTKKIIIGLAIAVSVLTILICVFGLTALSVYVIK